MNELTCTVHLVGETKQITDSFRKRDLVVTFKDGEYSQFVKFQACQDRSDLLNDIKQGQEVKITYFLKGREWTSPKDQSVNYFNSLDLWKIEPVATGNAQDGPDWLND